MNGSRAAVLTAAGRLRSFRSEGFPTIPMSILGGLLFVAIFADVLAPTIPRSAPSPRASSRPPGSSAAAPNICSAPITWDATCSPA